MRNMEVYIILNLLTKSREEVYLSINLLGQRRSFTDYDDYGTSTEDATYILMHILYNYISCDDPLAKELNWLLFESLQHSQIKSQQYSKDDGFIYSLLNDDNKFFWDIVRRYAKNILENNSNAKSYQKFDFIELIDWAEISYKDIAADEPSIDDDLGLPPLSSLAESVLQFSVLRKFEIEKDSSYTWDNLQEKISIYNPQIIDIYLWLKAERNTNAMINPFLRFLSLNEIEYLINSLKPFNSKGFNFYPFLIQDEKNVIGDFILEGSIYNKNVIMYDASAENFCVVSTDLSEYVIDLLRFWLVEYPTLESLLDNNNLKNTEKQISKTDIPVEELFLKK